MLATVPESSACGAAVTSRTTISASSGTRKIQFWTLRFRKSTARGVIRKGLGLSGQRGALRAPAEQQRLEVVVQDVDRHLLARLGAHVVVDAGHVAAGRRLDD